MVEIGLLHDTLASTLVPSGEGFRQAGAQLAQLESQDHFIIGLLRILMEPSADLGVKQASAVYLKNKINHSWPPNNPGSLNEQDKAVFKQQLIPAIVSSPGSLRNFLVVCLRTILNYDFREGTWPDLVPEIASLLQNTDDLNGVSAALVILKQLCKYYRWNTSSISKEVGPLMSEVFPHLLHIAEASVQAISSADDNFSNTEIYYQLIYGVLKIYKISSMRFLPEVYRRADLEKRIVALHLQVLMLPLPAVVLEVQPVSDRALTLPVKCQKWAATNIARVQNTFLTKSFKLSENAAAYAPFIDLFYKVFAPEITQVFISQLQKWSANEVWYSDAVLFNLVMFLEAMIDTKSVFTKLIEPQITRLLDQVLFPLMCPNEADLDLFEDDPQEFIQLQMDYGELNISPSGAASEFLRKIMKKRTQASSTVLTFLQECAANFQEKPDAIKGRVGLFKLVQSLAPIFMAKSSSPSELEPFMTQFVIPDLQSQHPYLRAGACDTLEKLSAIKFESREAVQQLFQGVISCFFDQVHLPVQVAAANALQSLTSQDHNEDMRAALAFHITDVIRNLLGLTQKVDLEPLLSILDHFVQLFPEKIIPFAVDLASQLSRQFVTISAELVDQTGGVDPNNGEAASEFMLANDEKINTGMGIMNSLSNLQSSLENRRELMAKLNETITPVFAAVYLNKFPDFYQTCMSLHENTLFTLKSIPDQHWQLFDALMDIVKDPECNYFEDAIPVLENYIVYGSAGLAQDTQRLDNFVKALISIYAPAATNTNCPTSQPSEFVDARRRAHAMSVATRLFVCSDLFNGPMNVHIKPTIDAVLSRVGVDSESQNSFPPRYNVATVSLVLAAIYHDPSAVLTALYSTSSFPSFLETWFQTFPEFTRVNDFKVCVVAVLSLCSYYATHPDVEPLCLRQMFTTLTRSLEALPTAVSRVNELWKSEQEWDDEEFNFDDDDEFGDDGFDDDDEDVVDGSNNYLREMPEGSSAGDGTFVYEQPGDSAGTAVNEEAHALRQGVALGDIGFIAEDFDEDFYSVSPLDSLNPYDALRTVFGGIQNAQSNFYDKLMQIVAEEDKAILQDSFQQQALPELATQSRQTTS